MHTLIHLSLLLVFMLLFVRRRQIPEGPAGRRRAEARTPEICHGGGCEWEWAADRAKGHCKGLCVRDKGPGV